MSRSSRLISRNMTYSAYARTTALCAYVSLAAFAHQSANSHAFSADALGLALAAQRPRAAH
jgi:hypothetical protein